MSPVKSISPGVEEVTTPNGEILLYVHGTIAAVKSPAAFIYVGELGPTFTAAITEAIKRWQARVTIKVNQVELKTHEH